MKFPKQGRVVAIDGPAGAGKSTVTRALAEKLSFTHVDTGALYRAVAWAARKENLLDPSQKDRLVTQMKTWNFEMKHDVSLEPSQRVFVNGTDITAEIRTPEISMGASYVGGVPGVRAALLSLQRQLGCQQDSILEGRDIGTVIFPDADVKIFLVASSGERANRRWDELKAAGTTPLPTREEIQRQIEERDQADQSRKIAPTKKASDAVEVDSTGKNLQEVIDEVTEIVQTKLK